MTSERTSWSSYFQEIARSVAKRSTCNRASVGAVIVSPERTIVCTGYNGSMRGGAHCDDVGHKMEDNHCVRTVHAEINALAQAAASNGGVRGCTVYVTHLPCRNCAQALVNAGIYRIIYETEYRPNDDLLAELRDLGVKVVKL